MAQRKYISFGGEDALFSESDEQFAAAKTALARNRPVEALHHFKAAYEASVRQDVVEAAFIAGVHMTHDNHDSLLRADYFIFVAQNAAQDAMRAAAVNAALGATEKAAKGNARELVDHANVARRALKILDIPGTDTDHVIQIVRARDIANTQMTTLETEDELNGTSNARAFIASLLIAQGDDKLGVYAAALVEGSTKRIRGTMVATTNTAPTRKDPAPRGQEPNGSKPYLN